MSPPPEGLGSGSSPTQMCRRRSDRSSAASCHADGGRAANAASDGPKTVSRTEAGSGDADSDGSSSSIPVRLRAAAKRWQPHAAAAASQWSGAPAALA
eukprot:scaffold5043_cov115-Isochrysis_galbana.AAC.3